MSIVLGFVYVVAAAAVVSAAFVWFDAGRSEADGADPDTWGLGSIDYRFGDWAVETRAPSPAGGGTGAAPASCRCCESTAHTTYWHVSR